MRRSITAFLLPALASLTLAAAAAAQNYPPPPPPNDPGSYGDQGYPDQQPYYQPPQDGSYYGNPGDQPGYDDQSYPDQGYDNHTADQGPVDESVFYGELSPYGRWIQRGSYGWVWEPTRVAVGWRPYTQGHWVETDYGWTWVSDEPWGWATYHYGRWTLDPEYGWLWVPGTEWGPAWVSFQEGNGYIGWAPLPPTVGFRAGFGIEIGGLNLGVEINPLAYSFVPEHSFLNERIRDEIAPPARNVTFMRNTRNITNIRVENDRVVNRSIPEERIQQVTGRPVHHYQLTDVRSPAQGRVARVQGDQLTMYRPAPTLARPAITPPAVIQRRQQLMQQRQGGQAQQVQPQPGRAPQQPQTMQMPQTTPQLSGADLNRKHQLEQQQLQARQTAERNRLQQEHQQQQAQQQTRGRAPDLPAQQQAEQRAQQEQHQREQQLLNARHQREQQAAQSRPPAQQQNRQQPQQNQPRETQQRRQREEQRAREDQQQRDKQPPPPPPQR
ncbi:MAG TPA: DUF6600 domain-containing protein [Thermoanaerobaculia bacterium]|jgi:hypothetical protein|nr:DUF6600 domain-containing protein [Thermoanaerobaculia bacterium]